MEETTNPTTPPATSTPTPSTPAAPSMMSSTPPSDSPHPGKEGSGAVVWVLVSIIVLVVLGFGGYYIWSSNQVADVAPTQPTSTPSPTVVATTSAKAKSATDEATAALNNVSGSDDTTSIKKDLDNTNLEGIDKENGDISNAVQ